MNISDNDKALFFYEDLPDNPAYGDLSNDEKKEVAMRILHSLEGSPMSEGFKAVCIAMGFNINRLK